MPINEYHGAVCALFLIFATGLCGCSGSSPEPAENAEKEPSDSEPIQPKARPIEAPLVGSPSGSGYTEDAIRVQIGPDAGLREQHSPSPDHEFLFIRLAVNGPGTFVPKDYAVVIDGKDYFPHAIGFGRPNGVYSSAEFFVGSRVDIVPDKSDQILHDGERVQKCELANPFLFLVYDVPKISRPTLAHGEQQFALSPDFSSLAADLSGSGGTLTAQNQLNLNPGGDDEYTVELLSTTRTRLELDTRQLDVVVVQLALRADEPMEIEIDKSELSLSGAGKSRVYFHFTNNAAQLKAGSNYIDDESYKDLDLIGLDSGGFRVSLSPAEPVEATMIFIDPKVPGDLDLKLSSTKTVQIPEPVNPLGKFPPPVEKLPAMVAWAPLIGSPADARFEVDEVSFAANSKQLSSPMTSPPRDGLRYLVVSFRVENDGKFVPVDYRLADRESNTVYRPLAVAFGDSNVFVKGLDYEKIDITLGSTTEPKHQVGRLSGWTIQTGRVRLLYEVVPAGDYVFIHGNTQFVIEP